MSADELLKLAEKFEKKAQEAKLLNAISLIEMAKDRAFALAHEAKGSTEAQVRRHTLGLVADRIMNDLEKALNLLGEHRQTSSSSQSDHSQTLQELEGK